MTLANMHVSAGSSINYLRKSTYDSIQTARLVLYVKVGNTAGDLACTDSAASQQTAMHATWIYDVHVIRPEARTQDV